VLKILTELKEYLSGVGKQAYRSVKSHLMEVGAGVGEGGEGRGVMKYMFILDHSFIRTKSRLLIF
jgi:hypothetical protein